MSDFKWSQWMLLIYDRGLFAKDETEVFCNGRMGISNGETYNPNIAL